MDKSHEESGGIEVSTSAVKISGTAYKDIQPLVVRSVRLAEEVLKVLEPVVGLPADFLEHHLKRFRDKYRDRLNEIPEDYRQPPPFRLGCVVLKEVAFFANEEDLQDLFASLLASGSDARICDRAHPSYASVITELSSLDAGVLRLTYVNSPKFNRYSSGIDKCFEPLIEEVGSESFQKSVENLIRLGLVKYFKGSEYQFSNEVDEFLNLIKQSIAEPDSETPKKPEHEKSMERLEFIRKFREFANSFEQKVSFELTGYGRDFTRVCIPET
ncbi:Abi-alpha family protein [Bythopirellula polymerisocia]|nr:Abi-alpha family protein [Bythopirellula polymerisocia]